ncbi:MAG: c-type cytochrome domain-containing protein [Planctomycetota bacterium]
MPSLRIRHARGSRIPSGVIAVSCLLLAGCGPQMPTSQAKVESTALRRSDASAANSDGLATSLWIAAGDLPVHASLPATPVPLGAALARRLRHHVVDHLLCRVLGSADGPSLAGCARTRREALDPLAPPDRDGNGTNLDDTLRAELESLAAMSGASLPDGVAPILAPRRSDSASPRIAGVIASRSDPASMRSAGDGSPRIDARALGTGMWLRAVTAQSLAAARHGDRIGASSDEGLLALVAIEEAMAIEETLLTDLCFDGEVFRRIEDPRDYDPNTQALWIPSQLTWIQHPILGSTAADWIAEDRQSDLSVVAMLMRGGVELGWLTDPANPSTELRELFTDTVLTPPHGSGPPQHVTNWVDDVRPILHGAAGCLGCHSPPVLNSNFNLASYEDVFRTGLSGVPGVVAGSHTGSALWQVVNDFWTPPGWNFPLSRMPFGGPYLPQSDIDTIARWIDDGALREQPPQRPAPRVGLDLARVMFRNLVALHEVSLGPTGSLLDRRSGTARSRLATARATGETLTAVAALASLDADEPGVMAALDRFASGALAVLCRADGSVIAEFDIATGTPTSFHAHLPARAALATGLLAAGRVLGDGRFVARGRAIADALIADSWNAYAGLFDDRPGIASRVLAADDVAMVLDMLRELQLAGDTAARDIVERFLTRVVRVFPSSEFDGDGEVQGDGLADTDGNGVVEPAANGLLPMLADAIVDGPTRSGDREEPVTWSRHVLPLFRARCVGCHVDGLREGGYGVDSATLAAQAGDSHSTTMIVPGDPDHSLLIEKLALRRPGIGAQMPLDLPPLTPAEFGLVRTWIEQGARDR